jgi:hypothetical protein
MTRHADPKSNPASRTPVATPPSAEGLAGLAAVQQDLAVIYVCKP